MAGTVIADKVQAQSTSTLEIMNGVALTPPLIEDVNGVQVGTFCRAWVNFNGIGTVAIRASFNVSSITDNGTGDYTVNFTNAMPDANYGVVGTANFTSGTALTLCLSSVTSPTTSAVRIFTGGDFASGIHAAFALDATFANVAIFR
jgi:hypothetical protein